MIAEKYLVGEHRESGRELYCSSLTFSIHCSPVLSRRSVIAMCVVDASGDAPFQCV
jgi:hypothetical protein